MIKSLGNRCESCVRIYILVLFAGLFDEGILMQYLESPWTSAVKASILSTIPSKTTGTYNNINNNKNNSSLDQQHCLPFIIKDKTQKIG